MKTIKASVTELERQVQAATELLEYVSKYFAGVSVADDASINFSQYGNSISVHSREDLSALMELAPKWTKNKAGKAIGYAAEIGGKTFTIFAYDSALPKTCRTIVKTVIRSARPAYEETYEEVVCDVT
jgi:hypothetical protein